MNLNPKKAPGFDMITGGSLKQLLRLGTDMITYIFNAFFRLKHVPMCKVEEVIMLPKLGNITNGVK